jgi:biopolymer transport protein ExbB
VLEVEAIAAVRDFVEQGGNVLLVIAFVTASMWTLIYERVWYFRILHKKEVAHVMKIWTDREDQSSWNADQTRRMLISQVRQKLEARIGPIETLVKLCPMLGLLGTVTGMIEVFDVMAGGGGNARGMAAGVSKATLPTMAGMVASISGMLVIVQIKRYAKDEAELLADNIQMKRD